MSVGVKVNINDYASDDLKALLNYSTPGRRKALNQIGARASVESIKSYHRNFDSQGGWFNTSLPTWGPGRKRTQWPRDVTRAWSAQRVDSDRAVIVNAHPHYKSKLKDRVITGSPLVIPIDPRAHGRSPKQFERVTGLTLFRPPGSSSLLFVERSGGPPKAAYILRNKVKQKATPGALPPDDVIIDPFIKVVAAELARDLEGLS